jgi:hypothetical protein
MKRNLFTDFIISGNRNVTKKENKNILRYNDYSIYIQLILVVKMKAMSVIIEATGTILLSFTKSCVDQERHSEDS